MNKMILTAVCALFVCAAPAAAFDLNDAGIGASIAAPDPEIKIPLAARPAQEKTGKYVQVSGYVNLNGSGWMHGDDGGFTTVNLTGWGSFRDLTGKISSNNTYVNTSVSLWVRPNQHIFEMVRPYVYVTFYRNGKIVGSTNLTGSISVTGWPSSNYFSLSGSGNLSGSIYVEDED